MWRRSHGPRKSHGPANKLEGGPRGPYESRDMITKLQTKGQTFSPQDTPQWQHTGICNDARRKQPEATSNKPQTQTQACKKKPLRTNRKHTDNMQHMTPAVSRKWSEKLWHRKFPRNGPTNYDTCHLQEMAQQTMTPSISRKWSEKIIPVRP